MPAKEYAHLHTECACPTNPISACAIRRSAFSTPQTAIHTALRKAVSADRAKRLIQQAARLTETAVSAPSTARTLQKSRNSAPVTLLPTAPAVRPTYAHGKTTEAATKCAATSSRQTISMTLPTANDPLITTKNFLF